MKTLSGIGLAVMATLLLCACAPSNSGVEPEMEVCIGMPNPWVWVETLEAAEAQAGFKLGVPEVVAGSCRVIRYGVLTGKTPMLEVVYRADGCEITLRKEPGEGKDISGVYGFDRKTTLVRSGVTLTCARPPVSSVNPNASVYTFSSGGYSWSLYAPTGIPDDLLSAFLSAIFLQ